MTKKKQDHLAQPITPDKWERQAERITLRDHQNVPHRNSTMRERYDGKELQYRGRQ